MTKKKHPKEISTEFIPSSLEWLAMLLAGYAYTPEGFRDLGKWIVKAIESPHPRKQVNRAFVRAVKDIPDLIRWLEGDNDPASMDGPTREAFLRSIKALQAIQGKRSASEAFGMGARRGPRIKISKTNEAVALYRYMRDIVGMKESNVQILEWASVLSGVSVDEIKKYEATPPITPVDRQTEAMLAACRLADNDTWDKAEQYFDTDDLKEYCRGSPDGD